MKHIIPVAVIILVMAMSAGCKKFVDVNPPVTEISAATTYSSNTSAAAVMTGIYSTMMGSGATMEEGNTGISYLQGLAADELTDYVSDASSTPFYTNGLSSTSGGTSNIYYWAEIFNEIHIANALMEGLSTYTGVSPALKQQLIGEAKFIRAFYNFYAVNLYGDIPLVTTTNYLVNGTLSRTPKDKVYLQIIQDLKDAQTALSDNFLDANGNTTMERIRPNKGAATALLARAYLYTGDWADAATQASMIINNTANYTLDADLNQVFLANSSEAIWQLQPVNPGYNTQDGNYFVLTAPPGSGQYEVSLSPYILNAFEPNDLRKTAWIGTFTADSISYYQFANKYKIGPYDPTNPTPTEYIMVFRLAEQFLIRAEAEARGAGGGPDASIADLNTIRERAGLPDYTGRADSLLTAIQHERQVELFTEWGHRWFDLIRTNNINSVLGSPGNICAAKGGSWDPNWALVPLPLSEIKADQNLKQNPGY